MMSKVEGKFSCEFEVREPVELSVVSGAGDVEVRAGPSGRVRVEGSFAVRAVPQARAERLAQLLRESPPVEVRGSRVRVGDLKKYAALLGPSFLGTFFEGVWIDYQIEVPPATEADIQSGSGDIEISDIDGPVDVRTGSGDVETVGIAKGGQLKSGSGDIKARAIGGEVQIKTGSGDISAEEIRGDLEVKTGSGDVKARGVAGDLRVVAGSGDFSLEDISGDVEVHTGSGDIEVESTIGEGKEWRLRAGSGDIALALPRGSRFRLEAESQFGEVESDFGSHPEAASSIEAKTGSGDIRIVAR
jgi:hypothetical protein